MPFSKFKQLVRLVLLATTLLPLSGCIVFSFISVFSGPNHATASAVLVVSIVLTLYVFSLFIREAWKRVVNEDDDAYDNAVRTLYKEVDSLLKLMRASEATIILSNLGVVSIRVRGDKRFRINYVAGTQTRHMFLHADRLDDQSRNVDPMTAQQLQQFAVIIMKERGVERHYSQIGSR